MPDDFSYVLSDLYDACTRPDAWRPALDGVVAVAGARVAALLIRDFSASPFTVNAVSTNYGELMASGRGQYYLDTLAHYETQQFEFIQRSRVGDVMRDEEMGIDRAVLDTRPDYLYLREHVGIQRRLGFRLNDNRGWFDAITMGFTPDMPTVPSSSIVALAPVLPHIAKAIELGRTFNALQARYRAALAMLDKLAIGILLAQENGEIIVANSEAERIFSLRDGLKLSPAKRLQPVDPDLGARLQAVIGETARTASGKGRTAEHHLQLPRPSGALSYLVEVAPLSDAAGELDGRFRGAMVVLVDPESPHEPDIARFGALHDLTAAEVEVCALMIRGLASGEIAERRNTQVVTARNQIAAVYQKVGVSTRSGLINRVIKTLPPIL